MPGFDPIIINQAAKKAMEKLGQDGKPVGDYSYDIQWDGNTDGKVTIPVGAVASYVKVSNRVLTKEDLIGATYVNFDATTNVVAEKNIIDNSAVGATTQFYGVMADNMSDTPVIVSCKACTINFKGVPVTIPSDGIYFLRMVIGDIMYVSSLSKETIVPIDPKYLPGVCLPVVELSTELNLFSEETQELTLNEADIAKLQPLHDSGVTNVVLKINGGIFGILCSGITSEVNSIWSGSISIESFFVTIEVINNGACLIVPRGLS